MTTRMTRCGSHRRHWFTYYGQPGTSAPECQRLCHTPNPNYDPDRDPERRRRDPYGGTSAPW